MGIGQAYISTIFLVLFRGASLVEFKKLIQFMYDFCDRLNETGCTLQPVRLAKSAVQNDTDSTHVRSMLATPITLSTI